MTEDRYDYAWQRQCLEECRAKGLGFGATLTALDSQVRAVPSYFEKIRFVRPRVYHDVEIVNIPHMGAWTEVPLDAAMAIVRMIICEHLQRLITPDVAAVVELGCGSGEILVTLAHNNTRLPTRFIGTEIAPHALRCVQMLAEIAGVGNVETMELDLRTPSFAFLKPPAKVLFYTSSVFAALGQSMLSDFLRAFAHLPAARLCAFEPVAALMTDRFPTLKPRFKLEGMRQVGLSEWVWPELKEAEVAGLIKFERIIPDMVGIIASNCLSLIQFSSVW